MNEHGINMPRSLILYGDLSRLFYEHVSIVFSPRLFASRPSGLHIECSSSSESYIVPPRRSEAVQMFTAGLLAANGPIRHKVTRNMARVLPQV